MCSNKEFSGTAGSALACFPEWKGYSHPSQMVEEDGQCPGLQACHELGTQHASQTCWVDMWAGVEELFWKKYAHYSCEGDGGMETGS